MSFNGIHVGLGSLARLSDARSRSISAENVCGRKGGGGMAELTDTPQPEVTKLGQPWSVKTDGTSPARDLGQGWKVRPCIQVPSGQTVTLMDLDGPGCIQHIWMTAWQKEEIAYRDLIVRMYWDGQDRPSVEAPLGDLFCNAYMGQTQVHALPINVNPTNAMHCYFPMPFREHARITIENRHPQKDCPSFFYTIDYLETEVPDDEAYFHAQFRRSNPLGYQDVHTILDGVRGRGQYVGTYMAWQQNNQGWWGEGEAKFYLDGDADYPTICGTGTEDYFGGSWCFDEDFSAPYTGHTATPPGPPRDQVGTRHSMYRFHVPDPIRFEQELRVTIQALGWRSEWRYLPLQDDLSSVAYWYQTLPTASFPALPDRDALEIV